MVTILDMRSRFINRWTVKTKYFFLLLSKKHWQIPLSKRFRALKLWFVIRNYGIKGLQKHIREVRFNAVFFWQFIILIRILFGSQQGVRLAQKLEALVLADNRFEIPAARHLGKISPPFVNSIAMSVSWSHSIVTAKQTREYGDDLMTAIDWNSFCAVEIHNRTVLCKLNIRKICLVRMICTMGTRKKNKLIFSLCSLKVKCRLCFRKQMKMIGRWPVTL